MTTTTTDDFASVITRVETAVQSILGSFGNLPVPLTEVQSIVSAVTEAIPKLHDLATKLEAVLNPPASAEPPAPPSA